MLSSLDSGDVVFLGARRREHVVGENYDGAFLAHLDVLRAARYG
jgi:hypothetical protein